MKSEMQNKDKKLIALLTNNDDDIYCFRKELIEGLLDEGYELLISCPYGPKFDLMDQISYIYDNPNIDRRGTKVISDFKLLNHYIKLFRKYHPDVVLTYTAKPNVYGSIAARLLRIPYINNVTGFGSVLNQTGLKRAFIMRLFRHAYRNAACVMFQNATNMKLAEESDMVRGKHMLIPGSGVALDRFPLQPYPDDDVIVFNYIGRILKEKGVDDYIAAAKIIREKYSNTEFNMIGFIEPTERHYEEELKELEEKGIIKYRGSQQDVRPFIARSHATIHPSTYGEGMSNVLLESAASGRPIITTDNPGCMETVRHGITGFIYQGGNVEELIEHIEKFIALSNEKRREIGEQGRVFIEENYSRQIVVESYCNTLKRLF